MESCIAILFREVIRLQQRSLIEHHSLEGLQCLSDRGEPDSLHDFFTECLSGRLELNTLLDRHGVHPGKDD